MVVIQFPDSQRLTKSLVFAPFLVGLLLSDLRPTGTPVFDLAVVVVVGVSAMAGATNLTLGQMNLAVLCLIPVLGYSPWTVAIVICFAAVIIAVWRTQFDFLSWIFMGAMLNVVARIESPSHSHIGLVIGIAVVTPAFIPLISGYAHTHRRVVKMCAVSVTTLFLLAVLGLAIAGLRSYQGLRDAGASARAGLSSAVIGDTESTKEQLASARNSIASFDDAFNKFLLAPSRLFPILSQNARVLSDAPRAISRSLDEIDEDITKIDLDALRLEGGRVDLASVVSLQEPVSRVATSLGNLNRTLAALDSPWLISRLDAEVGDIITEVTKQSERAKNTSLALRMLPEMLGASGERTYFLAFTTPSEVRGGGGFMGNWAEMTVSAGKIEVSKMGRSDNLNQKGAKLKFVDAPVDWMNGYARYGFGNGKELPISSSAWKNITMSPSFPSTGAAIASLYPQSGGKMVSGVFSMDVEFLATLIGLAGPVPVSGTSIILDGSNASEFLLHGQYLMPNQDARVDVLENVANDTIDRLLAMSFPSIRNLIELIGPKVSEGRFTAYFVDSVEQSLSTSLGISGRLTAPDSIDQLVIGLNNGSANKVDYFLKTDVDYRLTSHDEESGRASAKVRLSLTNASPSEGLPSYVIGNAIGKPAGWSRLLVSIFTRLPPVGFLVNGSPRNPQVRMEDSLYVSEIFIDIPALDSAVIELTLDGFFEGQGKYELAVRLPNTAIPATSSVLIESCPSQTVKSRHRESGWLSYACA